MARNFKDGGVPFCWNCSSQLVRVKGGFLFALVIYPAGIEHRVHKDCVSRVIGDGVKEKKEQQ